MGEVIPPFYHCILSQGKDQEEAKEKAIENLKLVEEHLKGKQFFGGETYGLQDFAFGWLAYYPGIIRKAVNLEMLDEETFPNLCAWKERFSDFPVIKENWPDEDAVILMTWSSPFALRVVWALKLKGVEYETIYEDLANKSSSLLEYNPVHKKVPVLLHNGIPICESLVILEYIDETWNEGGEDQEKAKEKVLENLKFVEEHLKGKKFFDGEVFGFLDLVFGWLVAPSVFHAYTSQEMEKEEAKGLALQNLDIIEKQLIGKKFFSGATFGFLDLAFGWIANYLGIFEETGGIKLLDKERFPLILEWKENFSNIPEIKENWPDREKLVTKFRLMREYYISVAAAKRTIS
ncbi:Glutathione S-transferase/chloride channel, C-terminal [Cynara cardunculus var. scolymus]|uniref:glutathione transferase n=1 Tax=Cynara cardunculus var. scolymus TaxID=59895 RepID=A0A118JZY9_CYNCS|nr:Glutathione S-transferase/chloride channel, C-terminal [Cynara cardunculus var. scolymus]